MQRLFKKASPLILVLLVSLTPAFGFGGGVVPKNGGEGAASTADVKGLTVPLKLTSSGEIQQIPLFSEQYALTPVALVNDEPITLQDFALELASMHSGFEGGERMKHPDFRKMLNRLITIKLVKQEALNIGFDRTPTFQKQVDDYALKTMTKELLAAQIKALQVAATEVEELYRQMAVEAKLLTYKFFDQTEAESILEKSRAGGDFKRLADKLVSAGKGEGGEQPEYVRLNDLLPVVASAVFKMQKGDLSEVFNSEGGFLVFRLEGKQVYEDPETRQVAANKVLQQQAAKKQQEYLNALSEKYTSFNKETEDALNFTKILAGNPLSKGTEVFARLSKDHRPVATISNGKETVVITVAEVAKKLESSLYHGVDKVINPEQLDPAREAAIWNLQLAVACRMEAQAQGIDKSAAYLDKINTYQDQVLFDTFVAKAVLPEVKIQEDEVKKYYFNHLEDYSSPMLLRMKSLVFNNRKSADEALKKLLAGSDFAWVSANVSGRADAEDKEILHLGDTLLVVTALPEDLQKRVVGAKAGDSLLYEGSGKLFYTLVVDSVFPPKAKLYDEVRSAVGKIIYGQKINEALEGWVVKLKEVYATEVFIAQGNL